ncbi:MAG: fibronectin type III domain-containing protein, partial [Armatimonadota bacterium]
MNRLGMIIAAVVLTCGLALAQDADTDSDGIPDMAEQVLGMDARRADDMHLIYQDGSVADGDQVAGNFEQANDFTDLYFGNVAGDRWVWRLDFADDFRRPGTILILYLDCDNDTATGRQDGMLGTDMMLVFSNGSFKPSIRNPDVLSENRDLRGYIDGSSVYYSMDLQLNHNEEGQTEYRAYVLSQYRPPSGDQDSSEEWFVVRGPGESDRLKPRVGSVSELLSEGMWVEEPWLYWRKQLRALGAVTVDLTAARLQDMHIEDRSLVADAEGASATLAAPVSGSYHLNVVLQDSPERQERVQVFVEDEWVALLAAANDDGLIRIWSTPQPVALREGQAIRLVCDGPAQDARISELTLTREMLRPPGLTISDVETFCAPDEDRATLDVDVCFLTDRPVTGRVRWGEGEALDQVAEEDDATYNHRVTLRGLERGATYRYRVAAGRGESEVQSEVATFVAEPLRPERCGVERARIDLSVTDPVEDRPAWPVSGGIPLPQGHLRDASHCRLLQGGESIPAGFTELAWWPDGSV